jgi:hypothetical protein
LTKEYAEANPTTTVHEQLGRFVCTRKAICVGLAGTKVGLQFGDGPDQFTVELPDEFAKRLAPWHIYKVIVTLESVQTPRTPSTMRRTVEKGTTIDVGAYGPEQRDGTFELPEYVDGMDYCHAATGRWVWSIGRDKASGKVFAAFDSRFYQNAEYDCLWLR